MPMRNQDATVRIKSGFPLSFKRPSLFAGGQALRTNDVHRLQKTAA
jgi:hypothetical protein